MEQLQTIPVSSLFHTDICSSLDLFYSFANWTFIRRETHLGLLERQYFIPLLTEDMHEGRFYFFFFGFTFPAHLGKYLALAGSY